MLNKRIKTLILQNFGSMAFIEEEGKDGSNNICVLSLTFCLIKAAWRNICKKSVFVILLLKCWWKNISPAVALIVKCDYHKSATTKNV